MKPVNYLRLTVLFLFGGIFTFSSSSFGADTQAKNPFSDLLSTPLGQTMPTPSIDYQYPSIGYSSTRTIPYAPVPESTPIPVFENKIPALHLEYATPLATLARGTSMRVLLLGQTGSGKSTFLNMAANYLLYGAFGVSPELQKMLKIIIPTKYLKPTEQGFSHSEFNVNHQGKSQTSKPKAYRLGLDDRYITFIDTPGMGDTGGLDRDEKNLERILKKAAKGGELSGIILFFNGAETRDNTTKEYTFSKLIGSIPDVAVQNMIVVLTNVRKDSCNFPLDKIRDLGVSDDRIFYMQNSVLASDPETWNDASILNHLLLDWKDSMRTMGKISEKLASTSHDVSNEFKRMYELRNIVKHEFHKVIMTFSEMQETQYAIAEYQSKYNVENAVAKDWQDFAQKATVKTKKFIDNPSCHYSTICTVHHIICHDECSLKETHTVGDQIFTGCAAFNGSYGERCSVCSSSKSCSFENHYHARGEFEEVTETLQDRLLDYKNRYDEATANAQNAQTALGSAQEALKQIQDTIDQFAKEVEIYLEELKKICKGYNFVAELQATINILKQEASRYTSIEAINSAKNFISTLEIIAERLTEQGFDEGVTSNSKDCTGFGHQINGQELDMKSKSPFSLIKGNFRKLKFKNKLKT